MFENKYLGKITFKGREITLIKHQCFSVPAYSRVPFE